MRRHSRPSPVKSDPTADDTKCHFKKTTTKLPHLATTRQHRRERCESSISHRPSRREDWSCSMFLALPRQKVRFVRKAHRSECRRKPGRSCATSRRRSRSRWRSRPQQLQQRQVVPAVMPPRPSSTSLWLPLKSNRIASKTLSFVQAAESQARPTDLGKCASRQLVHAKTKSVTIDLTTAQLEYLPVVVAT
jgi:hypothetical protein